MRRTLQNCDGRYGAATDRYGFRLGQIEYAVGEFGKEAGRWEERLTEVEAAVDGLDLELKQQI